MLLFITVPLFSDACGHCDGRIKAVFLSEREKLIVSNPAGPSAKATPSRLACLTASARLRFGMQRKSGRAILCFGRMQRKL